MTNTLTTSCPGCGARNPDQSQGRMVYGARGPGVPPLYVCGAECYQAASARAIAQRACAECRNQFDLGDLVAEHYCSRRCEKAAARRRRQVFRKVVAGAGAPSKIGDIWAAIGDVEVLWEEIRTGRTEVPANVQKLLRHYGQVLDAARVTAERELAWVGEESAQRIQRAAEAEEERAAKAVLTSFIEALDDDD